MEKDLYLTQAPLTQAPDTPTLPTKQRNILVKSLANPNDRRNQASRKVLSNFPLQGYYDDKKIKPGISLYKTILQTQDKRRDNEYNGPFLKINMHPTVAFTDNVNTMIYNEQGIIKTMNYISYEQFLSRLNITEQKIRNDHNIHPLIMTKCCNGITFQNNIVMNNEISSKIIPRSENVITTLFVTPYASYPNVIRLFLTPKTIKNVKKNVAYKIINKKQMTEQCVRRKHRLASQFMVHVENEESFVATQMKGKALQACEVMAESLCEYLQHALLIVISEIVVDFIVDEQKVIYFNDIKCIKSKAKTKLWQIGTQQQIIKLASQNNSQIMCRLCGMLYSKQQMQKLVTNKLIYQLASHLQNRGKKLANIPHMKKQGLSNVCHLCYELIKAEHTLINVQRQFAKLMNIRQNTVERVQSKETKQAQLFFYDEEEFQRLGEQASKYKKWRLFFYIEKLKRIPQVEFMDGENVEVGLEMKFQNQRERFVKVVKNQSYDASFTNEMSLTNTTMKNWSRSMRTTHNNFIKRDSSSSSRKNVPLRVQSAMPQRQRYAKQEQQAIQVQCSPQQPSLITGNKNNKSYFNDQTTAITHSQSYFSTQGKTKQQANNISNRHDTTIEYSMRGNNISYQTNNALGSLYQVPQEEEGNDVRGNQVGKVHDFKKKLYTIEQSDVLNNSSVPQNVKLDKVKMFIFYTKAHQNEGKNILSQQQVEFTLTFTPKNTHHSQPQPLKFTGTSSTLTCLKNKQTCQRHSLQIYLFDQGMKYCNLELTVGMVCDGVYDDEGLDLEKVNNLYWGKTYSCQPLPDQWMEVFTNGEEVPKGNMEKVLETLEQNNFMTEPIELEENPPSVNYLKSFETFVQSTVKPFSTITQSRPTSGLQASQSTSALKKTSMIRCKTALNRNTMSYTNLLTSNQHTKGSTANLGGNSYGRNGLSSKKALENVGDEIDEDEVIDFDV